MPAQTEDVLDSCRPSAPAVAASLTVAQLARSVGLTPDTVRYYERAGLLHPPERTQAGHRRYDDTAVDRLRFIQGAQRLGLRLHEIKTLLEVRDTGTCPCQPANGLLRHHITEVDGELARLTALRAELVAMTDVLAAAAPAGTDCPDPVPGTWRPPTVSQGR